MRELRIPPRVLQICLICVLMTASSRAAPSFWVPISISAPTSESSTVITEPDVNLLVVSLCRVPSGHQHIDGHVLDLKELARTHCMDPASTKRATVEELSRYVIYSSSLIYHHNLIVQIASATTGRISVCRRLLGPGTEYLDRDCYRPRHNRLCPGMSLPLIVMYSLVAGDQRA
jgi:hypothetical protein